MKMTPSEENLSVPQAIQLSLRLQQDGEFQKAEAICRKVLKDQPDNADALHLLGVNAYLTKNPGAAADLISRAIGINAMVPAFHSNMGLALHAMGKFEEAVAHYERAITLTPDYPEAYNNLGNSLKELGRFKEAALCYRQAITLKQDYPEAHYNLGNVLKDMNKLEEAADSYGQALALKPDFAEAHNNMGLVFQRQGNLGEAEDSYRLALTLKPGLAEAHNNIGSLKQDLGKFEEALNSYRKAVSLDDTYTEAYIKLANCKKFNPQDEHILSGMEKHLGKDRLKEEDALNLNFAMGKAYDDLGRYDNAFQHYHEANRLQCQKHSFNREEFEEKISQIIDTFSGDFFSRRGDFGNASELPVLIVGMPRSGTTLLEQIISSHPQVCGAGELGFWSRRQHKLKFTSPTVLKTETVRSIADEYITHLRSFSATAGRVTDKMPHNFMSLGLIHLAFPNARLVHCRRNPVDTCLSIYFHKFIARNHPYSCNLEDLAFYYRQYERLMKHWKETLPPGVFIEVEYENLVANQEAESRRLMDFCGLEWDEVCLQFHNSERIVRTPSNWQVRQPIYNSSVERWRNYEPFVAPLIQLLEDEVSGGGEKDSPAE